MSATELAELNAIADRSLPLGVRFLEVRREDWIWVMDRARRAVTAGRALYDVPPQSLDEVMAESSGCADDGN